MSLSNIKIVTYNIHKGFSLFNRRFVLHQIRQLLHESNADFAFLQEIQGEHKSRAAAVGNWPDISQFEFLADQNWPHYAYGKNAIYNAGHHGNAILSKYPFISWDNMNVSSFKRASRSILYGTVTFPGTDRELFLMCIHFDLLKSERRKQLDVLSRFIQDTVPVDAPVMIAGDFNDWGGYINRYLLTESGMSEAFEHQYGRNARTWPARWPVLAVDRIYFRNLSLVNCACWDHEPWPGLSDHAPLFAEFRFV